MPRFLTATAPVVLHDLATEAPVKPHQSFTWAEIARMVLRDPTLQPALTYFEFAELRGAVRLKEGETGELSETIWIALASCFRNCRTLGADLVLSPGYEAVAKSVLDAPSTDPRPKPEAVAP